MQVGLGMACAKIARSLPYQATSKIIEVLEGGTLFSDLLSESFRHQLEQYKILSCYEGLGEVWRKERLPKIDAYQNFNRSLDCTVRFGSTGPSWPA